MRERGWEGRPLLGELLSSGHVQAWTGSHRIPAARRARLPSIPMRFIDRDRVERRMRALGYDVGAVLISRLPAEWYDIDRERFLLEAGDTHGAAVLRLEIDANARDDRSKMWEDRRSIWPR